MDLNNDTDSSERARALHRVVRAMHDGECPRCHLLTTSEAMALPSGNHVCPHCEFTISKGEAQAAMEEFAPHMTRNLAVFEEWRLARKA